MRVKVKLFSIAKDLAGFDEETFELHQGSDTDAILSTLVKRNPRFIGLKPSLRLAVNQQYVGDGFPLKEGDEVAVIPPVSGG